MERRDDRRPGCWICNSDIQRPATRWPATGVDQCWPPLATAWQPCWLLLATAWQPCWLLPATAWQPCWLLLATAWQPCWLLPATTCQTGSSHLPPSAGESRSTASLRPIYKVPAVAVAPLPFPHLAVVVQQLEALQEQRDAALKEGEDTVVEVEPLLCGATGSLV